MFATHTHTHTHMYVCMYVCTYIYICGANISFHIYILFIPVILEDGYKKQQEHVGVISYICVDK